MQMPFRRNTYPEFQVKVDIKPSYEWSKESEDLGVSHRELEVLALVVEGYKNKEIGRILGIQHQSVKNHLQHLFKKLNVKNNTQAYIIALNLNMIRARSKMSPNTNLPVVEITAEAFIRDLRNIISGKTTWEGHSAKDREWLKVFLKEHGIEPYDWADSEDNESERHTKTGE
jgi:DNA-binding CsgD family transcriptional regulator